MFDKTRGNLFLELVNDIIYIVSLKNEENPASAQVQYINHRVRDLTGYSPEDFIKDPTLWISIVHPKDVHRVLSVTMSLIENKEGLAREYRIKTRAGNYIWVEDRLIPMLEGERVIGFIGVARDITKRKLMEEFSLHALEKDTEHLFSRVVKDLKDAMSADVVVIYEVPERSQQAILRAGAGVGRGVVGRLKIPIKEGTEFAYVYKSNKAVEVKDVDKEKRFSFTPDTYMMGLKSGVCIPIKGNGKPYGALCVYFKKKREVTKEEINFLNSVSNILGLAIKRERYEEDLEESQRKLKKASTLYRTLSVMGEIMVRERDIDSLLSSMCDAFKRFGGFKSAWVGRFYEDGFNLVCSCGEEKEFVDNIKDIVLENMKKGVDLCGLAFKTHRIVVNNDTETQISTPKLRSEMLKRGYLSSAGIPIERNGKIEGLFVLYSDVKGFFDHETVALLGEIRNEIAYALDFMEKEEQVRTLSLAVEQSSDWILITDREGRIKYVNKAVERITGYSTDELIGKTPKLFKSGKHPQRFFKRLWETILSGRSFRAVFINRRKDGSLVYVDQTITPLKDRDGEIIGFVSSGKDITQEKELRDRLRYVAFYDPVTELPNRNHFMERLSFSISRTRATGKYLALLLIDVDRFKIINDTYGYSVGDHILREMADRLKESVREGDTVGRIGSDEFGVILFDLQQRENVSKVINKIFSAMELPFIVNGEEIRISVSMGVSIYPQDAEDPEELITRAEIALAHAKDITGNTCQFYEEKLNARMTEFVLMERHLIKAIEKEEFKLFLQPYFDLSSGKVAGMEGLLRWISEDLGVVSPARFISVLESTGLIEDVGEWVLRRACEVAVSLKKRVSVNVSPVQFKDRDFPDKVKKIIEECGVDGGFITLEITESMAMEDVDFTRNSLNQMKDLGVKVAIDDFGTGYSSLAYLKTLPVDYLKIDVSFVRDIDKDPDDRAIVNAIIQLAKNLGIETIAEGIESEKHVEILRDMGCDYGQGYHLAKPMPYDQIRSFLGL